MLLCSSIAGQAGRPSELHTRLQSIILSTFIVSCSGLTNKANGLEHCMEALQHKLTFVGHFALKIREAKIFTAKS